MIIIIKIMMMIMIIIIKLTMIKIIQGSSCMWSEHIIRSALPGKPNLRSKLCQVSNDDDDNEDDDVMY